MMIPNNWHKLSKEQRQDIANSGGGGYDNLPHDIGGRDLDLMQIGFSFQQFVKDYYPMNGVPPEMVQWLEGLMVSLTHSELLISEILNAVVTAEMEKK